jgi:hypothetical protein
MKRCHPTRTFTNKQWQSTCLAHPDILLAVAGASAAGWATRSRTRPAGATCLTPPLLEGRDYYLENGLYVFTEHYLRQRGFCCTSSCRHCPYGFSPSSDSRPTSGDGPSSPIDPPR